MLLRALNFLPARHEDSRDVDFLAHVAHDITRNSSTLYLHFAKNYDWQVVNCLNVLDLALS